MEYLVVNWEARQIEIPEKITFLGVKDDNDTRTLKFKMPKVYKEKDVTGWNIWINYINALGKGDHYIVEETINDDGEFIYFEWEVGGSVYEKDGKVRFLVYVWKGNDINIVTNELHTTWAELKVLPGGNVGESIIKEYP